MREKPRFGIDLGGTKIEGIVLDAAGEVLHRQRIPTEREKGYKHILSNICTLLASLETATGLQADQLGIGTPGTIDPASGMLKNANTVVLNGQALGRDLEGQLKRPVRIANDANCFAIAETRLGAVPREYPNAGLVFGLILGTGIGGGIVFNNKVWNGAQGIGGEWGHMYLDHSAGHCYCGRVGCVEAIISGPALERYYFSRSGQKRRMQEIVASYRSGEDTAAIRTMERFFHYFAKGIANVINVMDPDVVLLGGGLGQIDELYSIGVPQVKDHLFNPQLDTRFLRPALGDSAGVFGAALLVD